MNRSSAEKQRTGKSAIQVKGQILPMREAYFVWEGSADICWVSKNGADSQGLQQRSQGLMCDTVRSGF